MGQDLAKGESFLTVILTEWRPAWPVQLFSLAIVLHCTQPSPTKTTLDIHPSTCIFNPILLTSKPHQADDRRVFSTFLNCTNHFNWNGSVMKPQQMDRSCVMMLTWSRHIVMKVLLNRMQNCVRELVANVWLSIWPESWIEGSNQSTQSITSLCLSMAGSATNSIYL